MMRNPHNQDNDALSQDDEVDRALGETFKNDMPDELEQAMTAALLNFQKDLEHHPYVQSLEAKQSKPSVKRPRLPHPNARKLAWLVGGGVAILLIGQWTLSGNAAPTWADVAERFQSVRSYSAVIYSREDTFSEPRQYEFWANSAGRKRMRDGTQVVFASEGEGVRAFDLVNRRETEPGINSVGMLQKSAGALSLETLMQKFLGDWDESTPKINADAIISEDLVVFDLEYSGSPNWVRVWALRESRLPVRIRSWAPRDGDCVDVFFSYSKEQPDEFFDPDAFALKMQDATVDPSSLAYAFLQDPGGRQVQSDEQEMKMPKCGTLQVTAASQGLSYETRRDTIMKIMRWGEMTSEDVRGLCGEPDEINSEGEGEIWSYKLLSKDGTGVYRLTLAFDSQGKRTNHTSQHRLLNPAVANISISDGYWKNRIEPELDQGLLRQDEESRIVIVAKSGDKSILIGGEWPSIMVEPGTEYLREMVPGVYDFYLVVIDRQSLHYTQEILLREDIDLATGEQEVRFD